MLISLQIGRGLAALAVAAFHLSLAMGDPSLGGTGVAPFTTLTGRGSLGVDFFFVLSGFIILQAHHADIGKPARIAHYLKRRFIRIYPIYWVYLTLCILGMALVGSAQLQLSGLWEWLTPYTLVRLTQVNLPLGQAWTLFHEIVFYAIFTSLLLNRRLGLAVLAVWAMTIALAYGRPVPEGHTLGTALWGANNMNFFAGMLAFLLMRRLSLWGAWLGLIVGVVMFCLNYRSDPGGAAARDYGLVYALSFGLILSAVAALESQQVFKPAVWLGWIGDASYSIYLLHIHIENYALRALMKLGVSSARHPEAVFVGVLLAVVFLGSLAYWLIERPLLNRLRAMVGRSSAPQSTVSQSPKGSPP